MPLFIDIHDVEGVSADAVAEAHHKDLAVQTKYGVNYVKYWVNEKRGKVFCLCDAPDAATAERVHVEAHGLRAERILEVDPDLADDFLGGGEVAPSGAALAPPSEAPAFSTASSRLDNGLRTIVFTDIVDSTAMTQRLGDAAAMEIVDAHDRAVRKALGLTGGRQVKHTGDGAMAAFTSAALAVRFATMLHAELSSVGQVAGEAVLLRIGAALGQPVEREGDFFGATVQLAARLCAQARPGQTLVSRDVVEQCASIRFEDAGDVTLKGFAQPIRAHRVLG